jgi:D-alanyl-D-alanine carboxypeptidase (penicillin-binding protein 5/6)
MRAVSFALGALGDPADPAGSEAAFVREMNNKADAIGMKNTYYLNVTGLDQNEEQGGAYGSAKDQAILFAYILKTHPSLMEATRQAEIIVTSQDLVSHIARNTDSLVSYIPGMLASKTGFTDLAGGNLVVAFDPEIGRPIIISVLGSTETGRFEDMEKLVNASLQYVSQEEQ